MELHPEGRENVGDGTYGLDEAKQPSWALGGELLSFYLAIGG